MYVKIATAWNRLWYILTRLTFKFFSKKSPVVSAWEEWSWWGRCLHASNRDSPCSRSPLYTCLSLPHTRPRVLPRVTATDFSRSCWVFVGQTPAINLKVEMSKLLASANESASLVTTDQLEALMQPTRYSLPQCSFMQIKSVIISASEKCKNKDMNI